MAAAASINNHINLLHMFKTSKLNYVVHLNTNLSTNVSYIILHCGSIKKIRFDLQQLGMRKTQTNFPPNWFTDIIECISMSPYYEIPCSSEKLPAIFSLLRDWGFMMLLDDRMGGSPAQFFHEQRKKGLVQGSYQEIEWTDPKQYTISER